MVTRKRKIETEQDRFGGYEDSVSIERGVFRQPESIQIPEASRVFGRTTRDQDTLYSGRVATDRMSADRMTTDRMTTDRMSDRMVSDRTIQRPFVQPDIGKVRRTPLSEEDLMPSIKTMQYAEQKKKVDSREAFENKTKIMLAVYLAIVVVLAAIVIGTGIVINSMSANITRLTNEIENSQEVISMQSIELAKLNDPDAIIGKAKDPSGLNMEEITQESLTEIELIPFATKIEQQPEANLFDKFCDWVKNLLGN